MNWIKVILQDYGFIWDALKLTAKTMLQTFGSMIDEGLLILEPFSHPVVLRRLSLLGFTIWAIGYILDKAFPDKPLEKVEK